MNKRGAKQLRCAVSEIKLIKLNAAPLKQRIQLIYLLSFTAFTASIPSINNEKIFQLLIEFHEGKAKQTNFSFLREGRPTLREKKVWFCFL